MYIQIKKNQLLNVKLLTVCYKKIWWHENIVILKNVIVLENVFKSYKIFMKVTPIGINESYLV